MTVDLDEHLNTHNELLRTAKAIWEHLESGRLVCLIAHPCIPLVRDLAAFEDAIKKASAA